MSFEQALDISLAAALGDDQALVAELRGAFLDSARKHFRAMADAAGDADWRDAALRLQGLAASFGAESLMQAAARAAESRGPDAQCLDAIERALVVLSL